MVAHTLNNLTPIVLISYRHYLQHEAYLSTCTINLRINALLTWCFWLVGQGHLTNNPVARFYLADQQHLSRWEGMTSAQVNALFRAAERSSHPERNNAIVQLLLQTGLYLDECIVLDYAFITFGERSGRVFVSVRKVNKSCEVPLNSSAHTTLAIYIAPRLDIASTIKAVAAV